jgi:aminopeptidase
MHDEHTLELTDRATRHVTDMVTIALEHKPPHAALVIYDTHYGLTDILTEAYRRVLPDAHFVDFDTCTAESIIALCDSLSPNDLVVLIQSTDFRLNAFRIRIHLFQRKLKVIDHLHLSRNTPDSWSTYVDALAYDPLWYRGVGRTLKATLEKAHTLKIQSNETILTITGGVEEPKLNIGDYTGMDNIGGTFPIGEVFTEAKDFSQMQGSVLVYACADSDYHTVMHEPFRVDIENGLVSSWGKNTPQAFIDIVALVKTNERALIREIGFGLNRAITKEHYLKDITAFERILGLHLSLGEKHTVYKKPGITPDKTRFHVDLFIVVDTVYADDTVIFNQGIFSLT